jgi:hypothetical protein
MMDLDKSYLSIDSDLKGIKGFDIRASFDNLTNGMGSRSCYGLGRGQPERTVRNP